jgi:ketosteroid isomerase-like protein
MRFNSFIVAVAILLMSSGVERHPAQAVAEAELAFARTSRETNTVNAFLKYLAHNAIMFREGEPVDGLTLWKKRTADSTLLNWWPVIADASTAGDLGYTTGPYQFFTNRTEKTPVANGYYSTIWQKQNDGQWKIKVDLGVPLSEIQDLPTTLFFVSESKEYRSSSVPIKSIEAEYNALLNKSSASFELSKLGKNYRLHRPGIGAKIDLASEVSIAEKGNSFQFLFVGGEESGSRDFAYSYGKVIRTDNDGQHKANYLRVWKTENGIWKIVLDVITAG